MEHIKQDQIINIPNTLTVIRILLLPVVVWRFVVGDATGALIAYLAAMLTDALDGIIARKFNQITALGKLLDPLADKLSLVTLLGLFVSDGQIPLWVLAIILLKEAAMVTRRRGSKARHRRLCAAHRQSDDSRLCAFHCRPFSELDADCGYAFVDFRRAVDGCAHLVCRGFDEKTRNQSRFNKIVCAVMAARGIDKMPRAVYNSPNPILNGFSEHSCRKSLYSSER